MLTGHLDGLTGCYLVGWAADGMATCRITVVDQDGTLIARGDASFDRPDLASLRLGRTNLAFRIAVPDGIGRAELHVLANGVELVNSPVAFGPGLFNGNLTVSGATAEGWVTERTRTPIAPSIDIIDQSGRIVARAGRVVAGNSDDPDFAPARFYADIGQAFFGQGELQLTATADGVAFAHASCNLRLVGHVEVVSNDHVAGWLFSPDAPQRRFAITVLRDGAPAGTALCNLARTDVKLHHPASLHPGFSLALPPAACTTLDFTTISLRLEGAQTELFGGPFAVGQRPARVLAARRIARFALEDGQALGNGERAVLREAMTDYLAKLRAGEHASAARPFGPPQEDRTGWLSVIVPIYRDTLKTKLCIESLLACCDPACHRIVLINDASPEPDMAAMLAPYARHAHVTVLVNPLNLGFVRTVNRGLAFCATGDVVLLNADTCVFRGGLDELWEVAQADPTVGTVTAFSNNATIFSYPHPMLRTASLDDIGWDRLAAFALGRNHGMAIDVPTGHGFCMLIRRQVLLELGQLDESFGRGYGEENDFCARAADLGYRNVAAPGAFVQHAESVSFLGETAGLLAVNLPRLERMYPEYTPAIMAVERRDDLRRGRWALDAMRLRAAGEAGQGFALVVTNGGLAGGTGRAIADIEAAEGYGGAMKLLLCCRSDTVMELTCAAPVLRAVFAPDESADLFALLDEAGITHVAVHQVLGFTLDFARRLAGWLAGRDSVFYAHDYFALCPRVTMIDAVGEFCNLAPASTCDRCVRLGGAHAFSAFAAIRTDEHRALFTVLLAAFTRVVTPSEAAAGYLRQVFDPITITAQPHPERQAGPPPVPRTGSSREIVLLGALGPHKGSGVLLAMAQRAMLTHPELSFRVIGITDIDAALLAVGNVTITGAYTQADLPRLCAQTEARFALFLSMWPETYSYTLSEALRFGFVPVVPDIGAPAERVRALGFGVVYQFPFSAENVLECLKAHHVAEISDVVDEPIKSC